MTLKLKTLTALLTCCALLLAALLVTPAQEKKKAEAGAEKAKATEQQPKQEEKPLPVKLSVLVIDSETRPVNDVRREDFQVFEDGVEQTITSFTERSGPLNYGLLVDNSGSMRSQLPTVIRAAKLIVAHNRPEDETFLIRFISRDKLENVVDWTSSRTELAKALDAMYPEGGHSAVIDAVYVSAQHLLARRKQVSGARRSALILVTDGEDRGSYYTLTQLAELLRGTDILVFSIGLVWKLEDKKERQRAVDLLSLLANETGGRAFFPQTREALEGSASTIQAELSAQYLIGYDSTNAKRDGSERAVRVVIKETPGKPQRTALTRPTYTAPR